MKKHIPLTIAGILLFLVFSGCHTDKNAAEYRWLIVRPWRHKMRIIRQPSAFEAASFIKLPLGAIQPQGGY
jgi:hypothetical protein